MRSTHEDKFVVAPFNGGKYLLTYTISRNKLNLYFTVQPEFTDIAVSLFKSTISEIKHIRGLGILVRNQTKYN